MSDEKTSLFAWVKFIFGALLMVALLGIHVWVKELPVWLFGLPAALWGIDLSSLFGVKK